MKIEKAIQQPKFNNEVHKAQINVLYTAALLVQRTTQILKPQNLSWQQFNILRILRGLHPQKATVRLLRERMIDKMSNASRLVERLKQKGFVEREPCATDRRRVDISITAAGLDYVQQATLLLEADMAIFLRDLSEEDAVLLNELLDKMRTYEGVEINK